MPLPRWEDFLHGFNPCKIHAHKVGPAHGPEPTFANKFQLNERATRRASDARATSERRATSQRGAMNDARYVACWELSHLVFETQDDT